MRMLAKHPAQDQAQDDYEQLQTGENSYLLSTVFWHDAHWQLLQYTPAAKQSQYCTADVMTTVLVMQLKGRNIWAARQQEAACRHCSCVHMSGRTSFKHRDRLQWHVLTGLQHRHHAVGYVHEDPHEATA